LRSDGSEPVLAVLHVAEAARVGGDDGTPDAIASSATKPSVSVLDGITNNGRGEGRGQPSPAGSRRRTAGEHALEPHGSGPSPTASAPAACPSPSQRRGSSRARGARRRAKQRLSAVSEGSRSANERFGMEADRIHAAAPEADVRDAALPQLAPRAR
jgi:hypothetical protein